MKVFITGVFRSGTSLTVHTLNVNKDINITDETVHFMRFCYMRYGKEELRLINAIQMAEDIDERLRKRKMKGLDVDKFKEVINKNKDNLTYPLLYDEIMKIYLGKENWGEKTNLKWRATKSVLDMFDDIYIIHVIRDPRDVLVSWKGYTIAPGNDYLDGISNLYDSMKTALENQKAFPERYYVLKYEDLVSDSEKEVKKLCDFLGLTFDEKMLDTKNFRSKKGGIWDPNKHTKFSDKLEKISAKPVGRWKEKLSKEDLLLTEFVIMDLMKEFGYEPSNTKWSAMDVRNAFANLLKSSLATEGIMDILKNKGGKERAPLDPLDSSIWRETIQ